MQLLLRILSAGRDAPLDAREKRFDGAGGTIGRDAGCDWILDDLDSLVSRTHARIEFRAGRFYIIDLSTNGVFVNGSREPLGHEDEHPISDGDQFRLGDYHIVAELKSDEAVVAAPVVAKPSPLGTTGRFAPPPPSASPSPGAALEPVIERSGAAGSRVQVDYDLDARDRETSTMNLDISVDDGSTGHKERPTRIRLALETVRKMSRDDAAGRTESLKVLLETRNDLARLRASIGQDRLEQLLSAVVDDFRAPRGVPLTVTDDVQFSVSGPSRLRAGNWYTVDVWVHTQAQRKTVLERATESQDFEGLRIKSRGPVRLARDTVLNVSIRLPDFHLPEAEDSIMWSGEIGNTSFAVLVPEGVSEGTYPGTVAFHADQLRVAQVHFTLAVAEGKNTPVELESQQIRYRSAFASYASEDRDEVLARIQGMQKVFPQLDIFLDVATLRSGERWRNRLMEEIRRRDVFYLFWSQAASDSVWVDREWRTAWRYRGVDIIDPVPLVPPEEAPPPQELAELLHFNDWVLAYRRGHREAPPS